MERKRNEYFVIAYDIFDFSEQSVDWTRDRVTRGFGEFEDCGIESPTFTDYFLVPLQDNLFATIR